VKAGEKVITVDLLGLIVEEEEILESKMMCLVLTHLRSPETCILK